jgi:hypothetical protein
MLVCGSDTIRHAYARVREAFFHVWVRRATRKAGYLHRAISIDDVYENRKYASFREETHIGQFEQDPRVNECVVYGTKCKSRNECDSLSDTLTSR